MSQFYLSLSTEFIYYFMKETFFKKFNVAEYLHHVKDKQICKLLDQVKFVFQYFSDHFRRSSTYNDVTRNQLLIYEL